MNYSFRNDYSEIAHPKVLEALAAIGNTQFEGYGKDKYSADAAALIKEKLNTPNADIHFISGGTHANLTAISAFLRPHEAVIATKTGHIFVHETGAIEATGHKVCTRDGTNGKLSVLEIESVLDEHANDEHMVKPKLVYISLSNECGTVYTKAELSGISDCCKKNDLLLYIDGARLGVAINSFSGDLSYNDLARFADAFFIGGTKNGALFGEAIVIINDELKKDFRYLLKQRGGLLAKGAAIGIQFKTLFTDNLYDELAIYANKGAQKLADGIKKQGYDFLYPAESNIIIPILPVDVVEKLQKIYSFYEWKKLDDKIAVRLLTSWATPYDKIDEFLSSF